MGLLQIPTLRQAIASIRARIRASNSQLNTVPGSVISDVMVVPQAASDTQQRALTFYNVTLQSLSDLIALKSNTNNLTLLSTALNTSISALLSDISSSIDRYAANIHEVRKTSTKANVTVALGRSDPPTQDLVVGIGVQVLGSNGQTYITMGSDTMFAATPSTYYNSDLALFIIQIPAEAVIAGAAGNAGVGTLTSITTPVSGFTFVTNLENAEGGQDIESDEDFVARLIKKWQAIGRTTKAGVADSILSNVDAADVFLAGPESPFNYRGFGRVDAYVLKRVDEIVTETFSGFNHPTLANAIQPSRLPLTALSSVSSGAAIAQIDTNSALRGSVQALDAIRFTTNPVFPVVVIYTTNKRIAEAQNVFNDPTFAPAPQQDPVDSLSAIETTVLVRQAPQVNIDYAVTITVTPGQVKSQVILAVKTNLISFASGFKLGETVFVDDFDEIVENTPGVLRLSGLPTKFSPSTQSGVLSSITPDANAVVVLNNLNVF